MQSRRVNGRSHILASYGPLYHPPNRILGLAALDDGTVDWLKRTTLNIWRQDRLERKRNLWYDSSENQTNYTHKLL